MEWEGVGVQLGDVGGRGVGGHPGGVKSLLALMICRDAEFLPVTIPTASSQSAGTTFYG